MTCADGTVERSRSGARSWAGSVGRVLRQPGLRRVLPAMLVSALGDGMSMVAVAWLAVQIAPPGQAGVWTGLAVAAYVLPATIGAAALARLVRGFRGVRLVAVDATLRAAALGVIAVLAVAGLLDPVVYVILLAVSSLLHAWGSAGAYTLIAESLPEEGDRVNGYAILSTFTQAAVVVGPALAGGLAALVGPGWVIGADAVSFAILAVSCWAASPRPAATPARPPPAAAARGRRPGGGGGGGRAHHRRPAAAARAARGDRYLLLPLRPGRGGAAGPRGAGAPRLRPPAGPVRGRVRRRRHAGRPRRGPAPAPFTVARGGEHRHRMGSRAAAAGCDRPGRTRVGRVRGRGTDLRPVHRHLHGAVPAGQPAARAQPRARHPPRADDSLPRARHAARRSARHRGRRPAHPAAVRAADDRARCVGRGGARSKPGPGPSVSNRPSDQPSRTVAVRATGRPRPPRVRRRTARGAHRSCSGHRAPRQ